MDPDTSPAVVTQIPQGCGNGDAAGTGQPQYLGVKSYYSDGDTYQAVLDSVPTTDGSQGSFLVQGLATALQAARLYDCAVIAIIGPDFVTVGSNVNFQPSSYADKEVISACQQLLQQNPKALVEQQYLPAGDCPPPPPAATTAAASDVVAAVSPFAASSTPKQPARATSSSSNLQQQQQQVTSGAPKAELSEDGSSALTSSGAAAAAVAAAGTAAAAADLARQSQQHQALHQRDELQGSALGDARHYSSDEDADIEQPYAQQLRLLHQHSTTGQQQLQQHGVGLPMQQRGAGHDSRIDQDMHDAGPWDDEEDEHMEATGAAAASQQGCYSDEFESDEADEYDEAEAPLSSYMYRQQMMYDDDRLMYRQREQYPGQYSSNGQYRQYGQYGRQRVRRLADLQLLHARLPPRGRQLPAKRSHQALLDLVQQEQQQVEQQRAREARLLARQQQQQQGLPQPKRRRKKFSSLTSLAPLPNAAAAAAGSPAEDLDEDDDGEDEDEDDEQQQHAAAAAALPLLGGGLSLPSSSAIGNNTNSHPGSLFGISSIGRGRGRGRGSRGRGRHSGRFTRGGGCIGGRGGRGAFTAAHAQAVAAAEEAAGGRLPPPGGDRSWLYELLKAEHLFSPCPTCSQQHKGWAVLLSYFDPEEPGRSYCGYCPEIAGLPHLLKIKRQGGALLCLEPEVLAGVMDVDDIQRYVVAGNKSKLVYLHPRPAKGVSFGKPAAVCCAEGCGRGLLDAHNKYCSVACKLSQEDDDFIEDHWPALQEKAQAAADAAAAEAAAAADATAEAEAVKASRQAAAKAKAKAKVAAVATSGGASWPSNRDQHSKQAAAALPKLGRKSAHKYAKYGGLPGSGGALQEHEQQAAEAKQQLELKVGSDQQHKQQLLQHQAVAVTQAQQPTLLGQQQLLQMWPQQQQLAKLEAPSTQQPSWFVISRPMPAAAAAAAGSGLQQQQRQSSLSQLLPVTSGLVLSPAGSLSAASPAPAAPLLTSPQQQQQQQQQQRQRFVHPRGAQPSKLWLHELVSCSYLLKPCPLCTGARKGRSSTGRDKLIRYFDPVNPSKGYCNYCPELPNLMHGLLHVSRAQQISSDFHFVRAGDVMALSDVAGVQQYPLNGQQVLYLRPRPQQNRGYRLPGRCIADGRALRDGSCKFCSLRCKLAVEDETFKQQYMTAEELAELQQEAAAAANAAADDEAAAAGCAGGVTLGSAAGAVRAALNPASVVKLEGGVNSFKAEPAAAAAPPAAPAAAAPAPQPAPAAPPAGPPAPAAAAASDFEPGSWTAMVMSAAAAGNGNNPTITSSINKLVRPGTFVLGPAAAAASAGPAVAGAAGNSGGARLAVFPPTAQQQQQHQQQLQQPPRSSAGCGASGSSSRSSTPGAETMQQQPTQAAGSADATMTRMRQQQQQGRHRAAAAATSRSGPAVVPLTVQAYRDYKMQQPAAAATTAAASAASAPIQMLPSLLPGGQALRMQLPLLLPQLPGGQQQQQQVLQLPSVSAAGGVQQLQVVSGQAGQQPGTVLLLPVSQLQSGAAAGDVCMSHQQQQQQQQQQQLPLPGQT